MLKLTRTSLIVAFDQKYGISLKNKIPWTNKDDMNYFKDKTIGNGNNCVIYGKNTFIDMGCLLPKRYNYIISSTLTKTEVNNKIKSSQEYSIIPSLPQAINHAKDCNFSEIFICGGVNIYKEAMELNLVDDYYFTLMKGDFSCDNFFPIKHAPTFSEYLMEEIERDTHIFVSYKKIENNTVSL